MKTYHYNLLLFMSITCPVFQPEMSPLKALAFSNTVEKRGVREETVFKHYYNLLLFMVVTREVSQPEMSALKAVAPENTV